MEAPVKTAFRLARKSTRIGDVDIAAGTLVMVCPGAINRDPDRFENPHEFRVDRNNVREHIAFARGMHTCPGAPLARVEGRVSLGAHPGPHGRYPGRRIATRTCRRPPLQLRSDLHPSGPQRIPSPVHADRQRLNDAAINATVFVALLGLAIAPAATASGEGWGLNGTYAAVSNGDLAQTNDVFRNEATVHSTWTINTTCTTPVDCTGRVVSDAGWSAEVKIARQRIRRQTRHPQLGAVSKRHQPRWTPDLSLLSRRRPEAKSQSVRRLSPVLTGRWATVAPAASTRRWKSHCRFGWTRSANRRPTVQMSVAH